MNPKFPFKANFEIIQGYNDNFAGANYPGGRHGALDIVPTENGVVYPALIYPVFNGSTISIQNTSPTFGEGIRENVFCDADLITYLKSKNLVPQTYTGVVNLEILYWHILQALDFDGTLTQDTPIAKAGNTGNVFHNGQPVPDNMKGVPPYPGLHLHLEMTIKGGTSLFNKDKDIYGRIDPQIILAYKGKSMGLVKKTLNNKGAIGIEILSDGTNTDADFAALNKIFGVNLVKQPNGSIQTDDTV